MDPVVTTPAAPAGKSKRSKKTTKPKAKKTAKKTVKKAKSKTVKKPKAGGSVVRTERLDMRLSKAEKVRVTAKAKKLRRTITSLVIEAIEKIK